MLYLDVDDPFPILCIVHVIIFMLQQGKTEISIGESNSEYVHGSEEWTEQRPVERRRGRQQ